MGNNKFRLVTRSDFDGLVCAVLLKHLNMVDEITFVHPKDMQDGKIAIGPRDITTNLPYVADAHLVFDHHLSEITRNAGRQPKHVADPATPNLVVKPHDGISGSRQNHIIDPKAPSAARVVYEYYGGHKAFPAEWNAMMAAVDKGDMAQFSREEILHPTGWVLLNYLMDARTGLGRFREFRISNYELMMNLIDYCRSHSIEQIMQLSDVKERSDMYFSHEGKFKEQIQRCAKVHGNLVVLDLRKEETIYSGNRFMVYALFPQANISIHVMWGVKKQNTVLATGKSIIDRSSETNIGDLMLQYGGGGHQNAGTCQVSNDKADQVLQELIKKINADG